MKKFIFFVLMAFYFSNYVLSQESMPHIAIIEQAFNEKNISLLDDCISKDCSIIQKSGEDFKPTCEALFKRLENDTIIDMTMVSKEILENGVTSYKYNIKYSEIGEKKGVFDINGDGKVSRLDYLSEARTVSTTDIRKCRSFTGSSSIEHLVFRFHIADNNLIVFKGELNGEPKNFIFDSGAIYTYLNIKRLNRNFKYGSAILSDLNNSSKTAVAIVDSVDINIFGLILKNASIPAKDLSYLEPTNTEIAGVIGMDILADYDIIYDYAYERLDFFSPGVELCSVPIRYPSLVPYAKYEKNYMPCLKVMVGDKELVFGVDCGATSNLISPQYEDLVCDIQESDLVDVDGKISKSKKGKMSYQVGKFNFEKQDFIIKNISHSGLNIDGILGYPFLKTREMYFRNIYRDVLIY